MRTSLNEIEQLEDLLLKRGDVQDCLLTEARVLSSPHWQEKVNCQKVSYELVQLYGRIKLRGEIQAIENRLFTKSKFRSFQDRIRLIFKH